MSASANRSGTAPSGVDGDDWETHWTRYAAAAGLNPAQRLRHVEILATLKRTPGITPHLLDVGSGQGDFLTRAAAGRAADLYTGFELSAAGIAESRRKVPQAQFLQVDLFAPTADAARFTGWATAAVCSEVIEHVDDPIGFLTRLRTYLAPGATLVLTVPGGPMSAFDHHIGHRRHYTKQLAREVLGAAGFQVGAVRLAGFPFFNLYRLMVILRGNRLVDDVESKDETPATGLALVAMRIFDVLFRFTLDDSPFGWQVIAVATNPAA